ARRRAFAIDLYISGWLAVEAIAVTATLLGAVPPGARGIVQIIAVWRLFEILQVVLGATIFDALSGRADHKVASSTRMIVLAGINFAEIMTIFGLVYALNPGLMSPLGSAPKQGFYLSAMTQFTIGYGDVSPHGILKAVAVAQGFSATIFVFLVFARIISSFSPLTSVLGQRGEPHPGPTPESRRGS
ncbi:ion channel, partial [Sphingomonas bacterium]|uniref:ion channel n=1 Tax=Sphingomonas bacterium TaxID=1895847 RepID=UPI001576BE83